MVFPKVTGWNPIGTLIFWLLLPNCLNWKIYCDDPASKIQSFRGQVSCLGVSEIEMEIAESNL